MSTIEELKAVKLRLIQKKVYELSLYSFLKAAWHVIEPGVTFVDNWHIHAICEHLEAVKDGRIKRLNINVPPRHAKSILCSIAFPVWVWITQPEKKFICVSYSMPLSHELSRKRRDVLESPWFLELWGDKVKLSGDQNVKSHYSNTASGAMFSTSTGGTITGFGADFVIADDLLNYARSDSEAIKKATNDWFNSGLSTRLNDPTKGAIVNIMQRLSEDDVSGMILKTSDWDSMVLPAEYELDKTPTSIGWTDPRTEEGEVLWKNHIGIEVLQQYKKAMRAISYAGQFQQRPVPADGGMVKSQWLQRAYPFTDNGYKGYRLGNSGKFWFEDTLIFFATVDLAITKNTTSDYTVVSMWGLSPDTDLILIDCMRDKLDNPEQVQAIIAMYNRYKPVFIAIESVAYQLAIVQQLMVRGLPVRAYNPGRIRKETRFVSAAVYYQNGRIYHSDDIAILPDLEKEIIMLPLGKHDDFGDTVAMAVTYIPQIIVPSVRNFEREKILGHNLLTNEFTPRDEEDEYFDNIRGEEW